MSDDHAISSPDFDPVAAYLDDLREALSDDREPPVMPDGLLDSLGPEARAAFWSEVERLYRGVGLEPPSSRPARPGWPIVPGYALVAELGGGAQGTVYLAHDAPDTGRLFAVKVLTLRPGRDFEEAQARVAVEVEALIRLNKVDGVVKIVGHGEVKDGRPFLAMDYVAGASLWRRIQASHDSGEARPQSPRASARLVMRLATIVGDVWALGIYHRDIKPGNILLPGPDARESKGALEMLDEDEAPVIADFGLAKVFDDPAVPTPTRIGHDLGTTPYMAPEQWSDRGFGEVGPWTDVWALGVLLYLLITGRLPFPSDNRYPARPACEDEPAWPRDLRRDVPEALEAILFRCLEKRSARRYRTAGALADDLAHYLDPAANGKVKAPRPGLAMKARAAIRRNRSAAFWLAILLPFSALTFVSGLSMVRRANESRLRVHDGTVNSARELARRGDWLAALGRYDQAIEDRLDDVTRLRIERLPGYLAVNRLAKMGGEVDALRYQYVPPDLAAPLDLARGTFLMCDHRTRIVGQDAVRASLKGPKSLLALSPANVAYAESLLCSTPREMLAKLRDAVEADPFHIPSQSGLLIALLAEGRLGEARAEANRLRGMLPLFHLPALVLLVADLCEGDRLAATARIDDLAGRLGPARAADIATLRDWADHLGNLIDALSQVDPNRPFNNAIVNWRIKGESSILRGYSVVGLPLDLPIPSLGLLGDAAGRLAEATGSGSSSGSPPSGPARPLAVGSMFTMVERIAGLVNKSEQLADDASYRRLKLVNEEFGDALVATMIAMNRMSLCRDGIARGDNPAFHRMIAEASYWSDLGANEPTLLPRSAMRYKCMIVSAVTDISLMKLNRDFDAQRYERLRNNIHRLVVDGRKHPAQRSEGLPMVLGILTVPMVDAELSDWGIDVGAGRSAYRERCDMLYRFGRDLIDDWRADLPDNQAVQDWYAKLDAWPEPKEPAP